MNYFCKNIAAVVVTYNPELVILQDLLDILYLQVRKIVIVDNGSTNNMMSWKPHQDQPNVYLHKIGQNLGIGAAQNIGIEMMLQEKDIDYILLSDQDSKPAVNMVYQLCNTANALIKSGWKVAAVGPRYCDARQNNPPPFTRVEGVRIKRQYEPEYDSVVRVDSLIASGCLISVSTLNEVGLMNEDMFIDYVDTEWGLRAQSMGFQSFGDFDAKMEHSLGEAIIQFLGKNYSYHSALRHYYMIRNGIWLYKQDYIPFKWKIVDGYRLFLRFGLYTLYAKPRSKHLQMMMKGLFHGLLSKMGPASV